MTVGRLGEQKSQMVVMQLTSRRTRQRSMTGQTVQRNGGFNFIFSLMRPA
jgi:hypothetical protein